MKKTFYKLPENLESDINQYTEEVSRFRDGSISPSVFKSGRVPRGIYEQRTDGTYMIRVRVAGGTITSEQMKTLASISRDLGSGQLHVTTRQDVQLHDLKIENTPEAMKRLFDAGLTSKGGGGNTVRNITACPYAGICKAEKFDVTPFAHELTEYLIALKGSYNLPRKYKIAFSGCGKDCALARGNDLGFIAAPRNGEAGFIVYAGGGMGTKSRAGDLMEEWVPAKDITRIAEGVRRLFDKHGDRKNRHKARLRFVFDRIGMEAFRDELHQTIATLDELDIKLSGCPNSCGQHPIASIGMFGSALRNEGHLVPAYRIVIGARNDIAKARFGELIGTVPARALPEFIVDIAEKFEAGRQNEGDLFADFFESKDIEYFKGIAQKYESIPPYADAPEFYRDWGHHHDFSLAGRGAGECGTGVFEVITEDIAAAREFIKNLSSQPDDNELFDALLPTIRALLITRGVDSRDPKEISYEFEKHFVDSGLIGEEFRILLSLLRSYLGGMQNALAGREKEITKLLDRIDYLLSVLDSDLVFQLPQAKAIEQKQNTIPPVKETKSANPNFMDLSGVACPMNFVKAKLKLEMMDISETLELILDDGRPIENVPASFKHEGQEIAEMTEIDDDHWRLKIKKLK